MDVVSLHGSRIIGGTVLWIGDTESPGLAEAYRYCIEHAPQVACRKTLAEAAARPASGVACLVHARTERSAPDLGASSGLSAAYPDASWIELLGPLCTGVRCSTVESARRIPWYQWKQALRSELGANADDKTAGILPASVAIVASSFANAESYLDLASQEGMTAVWCSAGDSMRLRNVDAVWWDDSFAGPVSAMQWRERLSAFASPGRSVKHVWLAGHAQPHQCRAAREGGIELVLGKPFQLDELIGSRSAAVGLSRAA